MPNKIERLKIPDITLAQLAPDSTSDRTEELGAADVYQLLMDLFHSESRTCSSFRSAFFCGGASCSMELRELCRQAPFICHFDEDGLYSAVRGGRQLLAARGKEGFVVDIGEASVKVLCGTRRLLYPRDFQLLPSDVTPASIDEQRYRARFREYVSSCIADAVDRSEIGGLGTALAVVPACANGSCIPGPSSYPALEGDAYAVLDSFSLAGYSDIELLSLSDVEMSAAGFLEDPRRPRNGPALVVMLGRGIRAAVLSPRP